MSILLVLGDIPVQVYQPVIDSLVHANPRTQLIVCTIRTQDSTEDITRVVDALQAVSVSYLRQMTSDRVAAVVAPLAPNGSELWPMMTEIADGLNVAVFEVDISGKLFPSDPTEVHKKVFRSLSMRPEFARH